MKKFGARIAHWITTKCPKPWAINLHKLKESMGLSIDDDIYNYAKYNWHHPNILPKICDTGMYIKWYDLKNNT